MHHAPALLAANRSIPACSVIPVLHYPDVAAAASWLCHAFGFSKRLRIGDHRVQLTIGSGALVIAQAEITQADGAHSVMVRVADVDHHHAVAARAGARIAAAPVTYPYGERQYSAVDPGGHHWTFTQTVADVDPADWGGDWLDDEDADPTPPRPRRPLA